MSASSYAGYWTGTFEGANQGGLTVDIREANGNLSGVARFSEPALGQYEYSLAGVAAEQLSLRLTPSRGQSGRVRTLFLSLVTSPRSWGETRLSC